MLCPTVIAKQSSSTRLDLESARKYTFGCFQRVLTEKRRLVLHIGSIIQNLGSGLDRGVESCVHLSLFPSCGCSITSCLCPCCHSWIHSFYNVCSAMMDCTPKWKPKQTLPSSNCVCWCFVCHSSEKSQVTPTQNQFHSRTLVLRPPK